MPYTDEFADKSAHGDLVRNPDVAKFLRECDYLKEPSDAEAQRMADAYQSLPDLEAVDLPDQVVAVDGSRYEAGIDQRLPSTRVGYVQVSTVLIDLSEYGGLRQGRLVNPFKVAKLKKGQEPLAFPLPSSNVRWGGGGSVRDSFRAAVDGHLSGEQTRFVRERSNTSLRSTLFHVAQHRPHLRTSTPLEIRLHKCPNCDERDITLRDVPEVQSCPGCGSPLYPSDALRLWEEVGEYTSNLSALTRFMNVVEHLMPIHFMRFLVEEGELDALERTAFIIDGPLALFGTVAPFHRGLLALIHDANDRLRAAGRHPLLLLGLQKHGQLVEHAAVTERHIPKERLLLVDDSYRYTHVVTRDPADNGFGSETYYGQDFIYRTQSDRTFVFALPFPDGVKDLDAEGFVREKSNIGNYPALPEALKVISHFESDLYRNAIVPVALAHRYTAISLRPGGKVLDLLTRQGFAR